MSRMRRMLLTFYLPLLIMAFWVFDQHHISGTSLPRKERLEMDISKNPSKPNAASLERRVLSRMKRSMDYRDDGMAPIRDDFKLSAAYSKTSRSLATFEQYPRKNILHQSVPPSFQKSNNVFDKLNQLGQMSPFKKMPIKEAPPQDQNYTAYLRKPTEKSAKEIWPLSSNILSPLTLPDNSPSELEQAIRRSASSFDKPISDLEPIITPPMQKTHTQTATANKSLTSFGKPQLFYKTLVTEVSLPKKQMPIPVNVYSHFRNEVHNVENVDQGIPSYRNIISSIINAQTRFQDRIIPETEQNHPNILSEARNEQIRQFGKSTNTLEMKGPTKYQHLNALSGVQQKPQPEIEPDFSVRSDDVKIPSIKSVEKGDRPVNSIEPAANLDNQAIGIGITTNKHNGNIANQYEIEINEIGRQYVKPLLPAVNRTGKRETETIISNKPGGSVKKTVAPIHNPVLKTSVSGPQKVVRKNGSEGQQTFDILQQISELISQLQNKSTNTPVPENIMPQLRGLSQFEHFNFLREQEDYNGEADQRADSPSSMEGQPILPNIIHATMPPIKCNCTPVHADPSHQYAIEELQLEDPFYGGSTLQSINKHHPNLAIRYLSENKTHCNLMPDMVEIDWMNVHWQRHIIRGREELLLYSAFYDNRTRTVPSGGAVRLVSLFSGAALIRDEYLPWCYLWYEGQLEPVLSKVVRADYVDHQEPSTDHLQTFLLTCASPDRRRTPNSKPNKQVPYAVSLVNKPCQKSKNLLRVFGKPNSEIPAHIMGEDPDYKNPNDPTWRTGVCGTAIFYLQYDFSLRMVEWLEIVRAQGVSQVFLYHTGRVHPNIDKVLRHYEKVGFVTLTDFHYPPSYMDEPLLRRTWTKTLRKHMFALENVYFTDCMLRNKDKFRFIAHVDPDELIVIENQESQSLPEFMAYLSNITKGWTVPTYSYNLRWRFYPAEDTAQQDPLPSIFHILRHTRRLIDDKEPKHHNVKTIYDSRSSTGVTSHTLRICADGPCVNPFKVNMNVATIGHFRADCDKICGGETEHVPEVLRHKQQVVRKVGEVLKTLNLLPHT